MPTVYQGIKELLKKRQKLKYRSPFGIYWDAADARYRKRVNVGLKKKDEKKSGEYHTEVIEDSWMVSES